MKLDVLTTRLFELPASGGELCTARLLAELQGMDHELHVIGRGDAPAAVAGRRWSSVGTVVRAHAEMSAAARAASLGLAWLRRRAWTVERTCAGGVRRRVQALLQNGPPADALFVDHLHVFALLRGQRRLPPVVLVMHNIESAGYGPAERGTGGLRARVLAREAHRLRTLEDEALRQVAAVACLSEEDADVLRARARALGVRPHVAVLPGYALRPPVTVAPPDHSPRRIGLIGTWTWAPNRRALQWVLDEVRPKLPAHCHLVLAGSGLDGLADAAGVTKLGRVADVQDFYAAVDLLAIAALDGTGVQEKAIEALGSGLPVVATTRALRGLLPLPAGVVVADDPAAFARACAEALPSSTGHSSTVMHWNRERQRRYRQALQACVDVAVRGSPGTVRQP